MIAFSQDLIGGSNTMDSEDAYHEVVDWNGYDVYYYYKWGQSYALWLTEVGILRGMGDGTMGLMQTATRAQLATVLMRLSEVLG